MIERYMWNWGFQYFIVSFLNTYEMRPAAERLITELENIYDVSFSRELTNWKFHIAGKDSDLSRGLDLLFTDVFPQGLNGVIPDRQSLIDNTDICLIMKDPYNPFQQVGIFGEVEGHHGEYIRQQGYWNKKNSPFSVFAFGVVPEKGKGMYIETRVFNNFRKVLITFQSENPVAADFRLALHWIEQLFNNGPGLRCTISDDELAYFVNLIKVHWHSPSSELLSRLAEFISKGDMVTSEPGPTPIIATL